MSVERISIESTTLRIEISELEAKVISRALSFFAPLVLTYIFIMCRLILSFASLGRDKVNEIQERMMRGENIANIFQELGIDTKALLDKSVKWPSDEEVDKALGWS